MPCRPRLAASGDIMRGVLCGALCIIGAVAWVPRMFADFEQLFGGVIDAKAPCRGGHAPDKINPGEVGTVAGLVRFGAVKAVLIIRPLAQIAAFKAGRGQRCEFLLRCDKAKLLQLGGGYGSPRLCRSDRHARIVRPAGFFWRM